MGHRSEGLSYHHCQKMAATRFVHIPKDSYNETKMTNDVALRRIHVLSRCLKKTQYSTCAVKPTIHLSKPAVLIDEKVQIVVKGLQRHQRVTLHSFLKESNRSYAACAHYIADEMGEVDTFQHVSHGGTFKGVEPMGLFWSMKPQIAERPRRLMKYDVTTPFVVRIALHDGFLNFEDLPWSDSFTCVTGCILQRHYMSPGVRRISVKENGIYGTLFLPPGDGPFPTLFDIFGLQGGVTELRSPLLASHGIASFSLAYVNHEDLPVDDFNLDFNYFLRAFDWLAAHPLVDENALGGISSCVGGGYVGIVAMKRPSMKCFVCINNSYYPVGENQELEGEEIRSVDLKLDRILVSPAGAILKYLYDYDDEEEFIPIWRNGLKILHIHGSDDHAVDPNSGKKFQQAIPPEFKSNVTHLEYSGAGHLIEPPYMPLCSSGYNPVLKGYLYFGGQPKPHADAEADSWQQMLNFFHTHLQDDRKSHIIHQTVVY